MKKKRRRWPIVVAVSAACIVAAVLVVPNTAVGRGIMQMFGLGSAPTIAATVSAEVVKGDVVSSVVATGNLTESEVDATAPYDVEIDEILVADGDEVAKGDAVATVDSSSLASRTSDVRDELDDVNDAIEDLTDGDTETVYVRSKATARVKGVYIKEGDNVKDASTTGGALALLSLDGLMAVEITGETKMKRGDDVTVVLSDDSEKDGTVERVGKGSFTVTLTDNGPTVGEAVTVKSSDKTVGEGTLEVHEPLKVSYGEGEVASVYVDENDKVYNGTTLLKISKSSVSTGLASLTAKRDALVALLENLSSLAVDRTLYAPTGGTVGNIAAEEGQSLTTSGSALTDDEGVLMTVADSGSMSISVEVDELDVSAIKPGLETDVEIDAIEGETFSGSVTEVSDDADVETGVAKYSAVVSIERTDAMKVGMSATATITKEKREGVLTIPLDAVQEFGDRVFVYTGLDGESGTPTGEQEIETGLSDGTNVEVVSGLNEGDTVYYMPPASDDENAQMMIPGMMGGGAGFSQRGEASRGDGAPSFNSSGGPPSGGSGGSAPSGGGAPSGG